MANRIWLFIGMEHAIFIGRYIFALIVPDVPDDVELQLERSVRRNKIYLKDYFVLCIMENHPF